MFSSFSDDGKEKEEVDDDTFPLESHGAHASAHSLSHWRRRRSVSAFSLAKKNIVSGVTHPRFKTLWIEKDEDKIKALRFLKKDVKKTKKEPLNTFVSNDEVDLFFSKVTKESVKMFNHWSSNTLLEGSAKKTSVSWAFPHGKSC